MPIVATVTRASVTRFFSQQPGVTPGNHGGNAYTLRKANGESLGTYRSVSEAQAVFTQFHGSQRILRWQRRDMAGAIEQHVCIGTPIDPSEIWVLTPGNPQIPNATPVATSLTSWVEPAAVPGSVKLTNATTGAVSAVSDISGSGNGYTTNDLASPPILSDADSNFNGRPAISLTGVKVGFDAPNVTLPYTVVLVANSTALNGFLWETTGATDLQIRKAGAVWEVGIGAAKVTSAVIAGTAPAIVVVKVSAAGVSLRINGNDIGSDVAVPDAGAVEVGGFSLSPWTGSLAFAMIVNTVEVNNTRILQTERYLRERYQ